MPTWCDSNRNLQIFFLIQKNLSEKYSHHPFDLSYFMKIILSFFSSELSFNFAVKVDDSQDSKIVPDHENPYVDLSSLTVVKFFPDTFN